MDELYWSLWSGVILGAEDDGSDNGDNDSEDESNDDENDGSDDDGSDNDEDASQEDDIAKLQKALASERRNAKKLERDAKKIERENRRLKATKATEENEEQQNLETAQNREREAIARAEKLAAGLLQRDLNAAIERAARDLKFLDPEDAIAGVDRTAIDFDQDEDDPTDIDIDLDTVKAAVKSLATRKPHYISRGTDDGEPTGSTFGGKKRKSKNEDEQLRDLYPSL